MPLWMGGIAARRLVGKLLVFCFLYKQPTTNNLLTQNPPCFSRGMS